MLADFEMLKLCDVIAGPVSSNYAKTAAVESMLTAGYLTQMGMCTIDRARSQAAGHVEPGTSTFEVSRGVEGMFADCVAQP